LSRHKKIAIKRIMIRFGKKKLKEDEITKKKITFKIISFKKKINQNNKNQI
jgi:hypothetical protein